MQTTNSSTQLLRSALHRMHGGRADLDPLIDLAGDAGFVLLGEATHGTHEFYATRAAITQRLIAEKGFQAVAVEADWPDPVWSNYSRETSKFMMDVPHAREQIGSAVGLRHRAGQSETPAPE
jgi:erythromycin esterase-like protein